MVNSKVIIVGGGLAGSEAALYLAEKAIKVDLYEMRPVKNTAVHKTDQLAELVCSNSLGSRSEEIASGLLKAELKLLGSSLLPLAEQYSVPAGGALAVDREQFARAITDKVKSHKNINLINEHVQDITSLCVKNQIVLLVTGPLTTQELAESLKKLTGKDYLHFYDAVAPIVEYETIDMSIAYKMDRYNKVPDSPYINCPLSEQDYEAFYDYIINAPTFPVRDFEKETKFFEACMPVEVLAKRGKDTLRYGPMKPVGLPDPATGKNPHAVVQLRQDNAVASLYNLVGFQTNLKWPAQKELLKLIPGLQNANIVRYGVMHRNTYINSPALLNSNLEANFKEDLFFAGQLTGVEGYTESIATGLLAAINIYRKISGFSALILDDVSMLGALVKYISTSGNTNFQPMNANWGIIAPWEGKKIRDKKLRKQMYAQRALNYIQNTKISPEKGLS